MPSAKALLGATALATAAAVFVVPPAAAEPQVDVIKRNLGMPLQVQSVGGGVLVNELLDDQGSESRLLYVGDDGTTEELVRENGVIGGHDWNFNSNGPVIAYTLSNQNGSFLKAYNPMVTRRGDIIDGGGEPDALADLGAYEADNNPDGGQRYGIKRLGGCDVPRMFRPYRGIVESNPYAVGRSADGSWLVADAAANAVLRVTESGNVSTVAVMPVQHIRINRAIAGQFGLPRCAVGKTMRYEPVPTDVEEDANGKIFVTLLPGGEGPTAVRGKLLRVNPDNGRVRTFARGFTGATNLAIAPGRIFVAELFGGQITEVNRASREKSLYSAQNAPASVDWFDGALYATVRVFKPAGGKLIKLTEAL